MLTLLLELQKYFKISLGLPKNQAKHYPAPITKVSAKASTVIMMMLNMLFMLVIMLIVLLISIINTNQDLLF